MVRPTLQYDTVMSALSRLLENFEIHSLNIRSNFDLVLPVWICCNMQEGSDGSVSVAVIPVDTVG